MHPRAKEWPIICRRGDKLMEGENEFRFLGLCASTLNMNKEQLFPDWSNRWPDEFEIRDVLDGLSRMGAQATRVGIGLSIACAQDNHGHTHITERRTYNEEAFRALDLVFALAGEYDIRIIFPFIASQSFPHTRGVDEFAALSGHGTGEFWTDGEVKDDFRHLISFLLNRVNTVSGRVYREDPVLLAWQFGNEFDSYAWDRKLDADLYGKRILAWCGEMAAHIRSIDTAHLIMEAGGADREALLAQGSADICSAHLYEYWSRVKGDPWELAPLARAQRQALKGRFPLIIDELGLSTHENLDSLLSVIVEEGISGGLLWGVRGHRRDGGWYYHNEGGTPVNSYHIPGFPSGSAYEETRTLDLLKKYARFLRTLALPDGGLSEEMPPSGVPVLYRLSGGLTWRGCSGAEYYSLESSGSGQGPWRSLRTGLHDSILADVKSYESGGHSGPLLLWHEIPAEDGSERFYRIKAVNSCGESPYSEILRVEGNWKKGALVK